MKIIHTADNHLDMPLSLLPPEKALIRKRERLESFAEIIQYTISSKADMLIISGDLFHTPSPSKEILAFCYDEFKKLGDTPVFISLGNHDYALESAHFPGNVRIFPKEQTTFTLGGATVTGSSFSSPSADFAKSITPPQQKDLINILSLHAHISSNSQYNPIDKSFLSSLGYDYIALGHIHEKEIFHRMAYPGCHDGGGFDETGVKGFLDCDITKESCHVTFIPSSYRLYEVIELDISSFSSTNALIDALEEKMEEGIYKIILTGTLNDGFIINKEYLQTVLSQKAFFVKLEEEYTIDSNLVKGELYSKAAEYITENSSDEIKPVALSYLEKALKGVPLYDI